jgi:hypothetical protein
VRLLTLLNRTGLGKLASRPVAAPRAGQPSTLLVVPAYLQRCLIGQYACSAYYVPPLP